MDAPLTRTIKRYALTGCKKLSLLPGNDIEVIEERGCYGCWIMGASAPLTKLRYLEKNALSYVGATGGTRFDISLTNSDNPIRINVENDVLEFIGDTSDIGNLTEVKGKCRIVQGDDAMYVLFGTASLNKLDITLIDAVKIDGDSFNVSVNINPLRACHQSSLLQSITQQICTAASKDLMSLA